MKVGDYVRTKKGIAKIIDKNDDVRYHYPNAWVTDTYLEINDDTEYVYDEDILKSSPNIIDLIEAGDYINGDRVVEHAYEPRKLYVENIYVGGKGQTTIENYSYELTSKYCYDEPDFIKSIVTKEQFENCMYKVGE